MAGTIALVCTVFAAAALIACGGGGAYKGGASTAPPPAATAAPAAAAPAASAAAGGGAASVSAGLRTLGAVKFADRGTASVAGKSELAVAAADFAFTPTFVQGTPGQRVTLQITNDSTTPHNLSVAAQKVDKELAAKSKATVDVTIPQAGVLLFFCKFHTASGMNGELLAGTAAPAAVEAPEAAGAADAGY